MSYPSQPVKRAKRLPLLGLVAALCSLIALGTTTGDASAAPPTPTVQATAAGNGIDFSVSSSVAVNWQIQIESGQAPSGTPPSFGAPDRTAIQVGAPRTSYSHRFRQILTDTTYYYIVKATDASGQSSYRTGSVRSLKRSLRVTYHAINIIDDGDPEWYRGEGEMSFVFATNRCWAGKTGWVTRGDGERYFPERSLGFYPYNLPTLEMAVLGVERDVDVDEILDPNVNKGLPVHTGCEGAAIQPGYASSIYWDWARASSRIDLRETFDHAENSATERWWFLSPSSGKLRFEVEMILEFSYSA